MQKSSRISGNRVNLIDALTKPGGGIAFDPKFFIDWPKGQRPHQVRLQAGDCSSDSYCYP